MVMKTVATDKNEPLDIGAPTDVWVWYGKTKDYEHYPIHVIQAARGEKFVAVHWDERLSPCNMNCQRANAIDLLRQYVKDWQ